MARGMGRLAATSTVVMLATAIGLPATSAAGSAADAPRVVDAAGSGSGAGHPRDLGRGPENATQPSGRAFAPGVVLVAFDDETSSSQRGAARRVAHARGHSQVSKLAKGLERLELEPGTSVESAVEALHGRKGIRFAEPDYLVTPDHDSNDWVYTDGNLWGMEAGGYGSGAAAAWASNQVGSRDVYVGIIDTGVDISHKDLAPNIWTNPFETPGNHVDDDGNGYIDDVHGWDFFHGDASVYDSAASDFHGTHVAGTIGGAGANGEGVAGVNWAVTMIPLKFIDGDGAISDAIAALDYLTELKTEHGLNVIASNNSWGGVDESDSQALEDAINRGGDAGILFVSSAGNDGLDTDAVAHHPSDMACDTRFDDGQARGYDCLIAVAALAENGALADFSNYGATTVDIGAPGVHVASTYPGNDYVYLNGTSMAAPHVTGALALLASCQGSSTPDGLEASLYDHATATTSLVGKTATGARVQVDAMLADCDTGAAPRALIVPAAGGTDTPAEFQVLFSEGVTGLAVGDFTLGGTSMGWSVDMVGGTSGTASYSITVLATSPLAGTLSVTLAAGSVDGLTLSGPTAPVTVTTVVDRAAPTTSAPTPAIGSGAPLSGAAIPVKVSWKVSDAGTGSRFAEIFYSRNGGAFQLLSDYYIGSTAYLYLNSSGSYRFKVRVHDWAGHVSAYATGPTFLARLRQEWDPAIAYGGSWANGSSSSFSASKVKYTSAGGRSAVYTGTFRSVGFVTTLALNRGVVKIFVDGVLSARIDLGKPLAYRQVVWSKTFAAVKTHKVKVVVLGGYGRVDIDAFAYLK